MDVSGRFHCSHFKEYLFLQVIQDNISLDNLTKLFWNYCSKFRDSRMLPKLLQCYCSISDFYPHQTNQFPGPVTFHRRNFSNKRGFESFPHFNVWSHDVVQRHFESRWGKSLWLGESVGTLKRWWREFCNILKHICYLIGSVFDQLSTEIHHCVFILHKLSVPIPFFDAGKVSSSKEHSLEGKSDF